VSDNRDENHNLRDPSSYVKGTDDLERFGTRLEQQFSDSKSEQLWKLLDWKRSHLLSKNQTDTPQGINLSDIASMLKAVSRWGLV